MDYLPYVTAIGGLAIGGLSNFVNLWANRNKAKIDVGKQITDSFNALTASLQKERTDLLAQIDRQDEKIERQGLKIDQQAARITHLESYINIMQSHTHDLETIMLNAGMTVPILKMEYKP